jgi:hypothetical protein
LAILDRDNLGVSVELGSSGSRIDLLGGGPMLHRFDQKHVQEFTIGEFFLAVFLNLGLVVACFYGFQAAYQIQDSSYPNLLIQQVP